MPERPELSNKPALTEADRRRPLQDLDGQDWGEPTFPSHVVTEAHRLRRVPIGDFRVEDLRLMIGQGIGLPYLMPLALEHLVRRPLSEGDFYPGDLLHSVLSVPPEFWLDYPSWRRDVERRVLRNIRKMPAEVADLASAFTKAARKQG